MMTFGLTVALVLAQPWLTPMLAGPWRWAALAFLVGGGLATYAIAAQILGAFDIRELAAMARRRR